MKYQIHGRNLNPRTHKHKTEFMNVTCNPSFTRCTRRNIVSHIQSIKDNTSSVVVIALDAFLANNNNNNNIL